MNQTDELDRVEASRDRKAFLSQITPDGCRANACILRIAGETPLGEIIIEHHAPNRVADSKTFTPAVEPAAVRQWAEAQHAPGAPVQTDDRPINAGLYLNVGIVVHGEEAIKHDGLAVGMCIADLQREGWTLNELTTQAERMTAKFSRGWEAHGPRRTYSAEEREAMTTGDELATHPK